MANLWDVKMGADAKGNIVGADWQTYGQAQCEHRPDQAAAGHGHVAGGPGLAAASRRRTRCTRSYQGSRAKRVLAKTQPLYGGAFKCNFLRAPSAPQQFFASEQIVDELANAMNMDPVAFRRQNIDGTTRPAHAGWQCSTVRRGGRLEAEGGRVEPVGSGNVVNGPRLRLRHVRRQPGRHRRRRAGEQEERQDGREAPVHRPEQRDHGRPAARREPDERRGDPGPLAGDAGAERVHQGADHEPGLGDVPDPALRRCSEGDARQRSSGRVRHGQPGLLDGRRRTST